MLLIVVISFQFPANLLLNLNGSVDSDKMWFPKDGIENFYSSSQPFNYPQPEVQTRDNLDLLDPNVEQSIALLNHSKTSSFTKVKRMPFGPSSGPNYRGDYKSSSTTSSGNALDLATSGSSSISAVDENLLTSDKTHFRPIKQTYLDGHTFDIPGSPDNVEYVRSESGSIFFDLEKYMEYNLDSVAVGDGDQGDQTNVAITCSGGFAEEGSKTAFSDGQEGQNKLGHRPKELAAANSSSYKFTLKFCVKQNEKYCQTEMHDFERVAALETLQEMKRMENPGECDLSENDFDRFNDKWAILTDDHSNWGNMIGCDEDSYMSFASLPANRLMRDELSLDGEEILSDLKYMQNLYIGEASDDEVDYDTSSWYIKNKSGGNLHPDDEECLIIEEKPNNEKSYYNMDRFISDLLRPETVKSLAQVLGEQNGKSLLDGLSNKTDIVQETNEIFWHKNWSQQKEWLPVNSVTTTTEEEEIAWLPKSDDAEKMVNLAENVWNFEKDVANPENPPADWEYSNLRALWSDGQNEKKSEVRDRQTITQKCCNVEGKKLPLKNCCLIMLDKANHQLNPAVEREVVHIRAARKRRHSASQNLNDELELFDSRYLSSKIMDYCKCECGGGGTDDRSEGKKAIPSTTIITCKYLAANMKTMLKHRNKLLPRKLNKFDALPTAPHTYDKNWLLHNFDMQIDDVVNLLNERNQNDGGEQFTAVDDVANQPENGMLDDLDEDIVETQFFPLIHHHHGKAMGSIFGRAAHMVALARPLTR